MNSPAAESLPAPETYHERVAQTRWGSYISEHELAAIQTAHRLAGEPGTVLDIGCDGGRWSIVLSEWGWQPICIDVDPDALAICARRLPHAICLREDEDYDRLPVANGSIDLVLCIEVPPVLYSGWFLAECHRALKPGGLAVVVFWNRGSIRGLVASTRAVRRNTYNYYRYRYVDWMEGVRETGFTTEWEEGLCWAPLSRQSNSALVDPMVQLEETLGLRKLTRYAPWVICVLRRGA